jgi:G3E family GTPase
MSDANLDLTGALIPVSLLTGFLGSGKTTLLNRLLRDPAMAETLVLINEFGEIGLDHHLVQSVDAEMIVMASGCLCCTVQSDLSDTLRRMAIDRVRGKVPNFRRVVIETTGLADPAPILHTIMAEPRLQALYRVDRVVTTVDAVNALSQLETQYEAAKQAALADRLVLTKSDLVSPAERDRVLARLTAINPLAPVAIVIQGKIEPKVLFADDPPAAELRRDRLAAAEALGAAHHDHDHDHHEGGADHMAAHHGITTTSLAREEPVPWPRLRAWLTALATLKGPDLLRVKGILNVEGRAGPVIIHGVQHVFHPPVELKSWPDEDRRSRLVFITRNIKADDLARSFTAAMTDGAPVTFPR